MKIRYTDRTMQPWLLLGAAVLLAAAAVACASGYGRLNRDPAVTEKFTEARFSEHYRFYYIGRDNQPYAIVGIRDGYTFRSEFWSSVDPSSEMFAKMVDHPWGFQDWPPYGAYILDSKGNRVGIWYSSYHSTTIRVTDDNGVYVHNPYSPTGDMFDPLIK